MFKNVGKYSFYSGLNFIIILILPLTSCCQARLQPFCVHSPRYLRELVSECLWIPESTDTRVSCVNAHYLHGAYTKPLYTFFFIVKGKASFIHTAHSHLRSLWGIYRRTKVCLQKSKNKRPVKILHFHVLAKNYSKLKRPKKKSNSLTITLKTKSTSRQI